MASSTMSGEPASGSCSSIAAAARRRRRPTGRDPIRTDANFSRGWRCAFSTDRSPTTAIWSLIPTQRSGSTKRLRESSGRVRARAQRQGIRSPLWATGCWRWSGKRPPCPSSSGSISAATRTGRVSTSTARARRSGLSSRSRMARLSAARASRKQTRTSRSRITSGARKVRQAAS